MGIAFNTFIGVLLFHVRLVFESSNIWKVHLFSFIKKFQSLTTIIRIAPVQDNTTMEGGETAELHALPTFTEVDVDLREPLLEVTESHAVA